MNKLHLVLRSERETSLELNYQLSCDQKIRIVEADLMTFVQDGQFDLLARVDTVFMQFDFERVFIDLF
jgi:hypothetical protein